MKTTILIIVTAIVILAVGSVASSATDSLPKGVTKFQDGDITCYIYNKKSISCVNNPNGEAQPLPASSSKKSNKDA